MRRSSSRSPRHSSFSSQAQRIAYSVSTIDQAFTQTYPQAYSSGTSSQQLLTDAQITLAERARRVPGRHARASRRRTEPRLDAHPDRRAGDGSQGATGALQAAQSGNQLVAIQTKQLADLTAVMASIARAQSLDAARTLETQAQAQAQMQNFLNYGAGYQPGSAQMFH